MAFHLHCLSSISQPSGCHLTNSSIIRRFPVKSMNRRRLFRDFGVKAFFFNPTQEPILKEALKVSIFSGLNLILDAFQLISSLKIY
ncbi:hypothetical protein RJ641_015051 [Dillenia turbinata]|uniref:Uncharacterized protein n=1 Tax=Dillenia turbinata TaxID=194707 RepID=A0AAN8V4N4_9MAGN